MYVSEFDICRDLIRLLGGVESILYIEAWGHIL